MLNYRNYLNNRNYRKLVYLGCWLFLSMGCITSGNEGYDFEQLKGHPVKQRTYWSQLSAEKRSILQKVIKPNADVMRLVRDKMGSKRIKPVGLDEDQRRSVTRAMRELPHSLLRKTNERLIAIFFVDGLRGRKAFTEYVLGADEQPTGAFVVLDTSILRTGVNQYLTRREASAFDLKNSRLAVYAAPPGEDSPKLGFQFALLEQLAHVLSIGENQHPLWDRQPGRLEHPSGFVFSKRDWSLDRDGRFITRFDRNFPQRRKIDFYERGGRLSGTEMIETYRSLYKDHFASLKAARTPHDDFAQSVATYVHMRLLGRPYQVVASEKNGSPVSFRPCWGEPACSHKERLLRQVLLGH